MMPHTVTVEPHSGRDQYDAPSYGTAQTIANSRVVYRRRWIRRADGTEVMSRGVVWLGAIPSPVIDPEVRITLPDGSTPPVLDVEELPDEDGAHHIKVTFG